MAAFDVDGGFHFHQAFIDLPGGTYQFIWEVRLDQLEPVEIVRNYRAAIDDVVIGLQTCARMRKFLPTIAFYPNHYHNVNLIDERQDRMIYGVTIYFLGCCILLN